MNLILFLIIFPLAIAVLALCSRNPRLRDWVVNLGSAGTFVGSVALLALKFRGPVLYFELDSVWIERGMFAAEAFIGIFILTQALKYRKYPAAILIACQAALVGYLETVRAPGVPVEHSLFIDKLSIIMALVIGVVGSLISLYAVGYMRDFHNRYHRELKDARGFFFFVIFLFTSAMFGLVFANNLSWVYFFWEITTLSSFLLIGYKKTDEARNNAFLALTYNLIGGMAFAVALAYLYINVKTIEMDKLMFMGKAAALVPAALMCLAGLTKSAQMPFSSWLRGAMVAPTPVSALLHSSTMVKAGVYIIVRFAAVLHGTYAGFILALIGGTTFLVTSLVALTHSDAKKILAYSTIANLGLIVMCAGIGTYESLWAAAMLIIFHAIAKCLLFLCVGTIEHKVHSRDIEDMSGLIVTMPKLSIMMQIGMAGMFLAPFGMLISKWAVLKALVDYNPLFAIFVVFGSSATLFFWVKWMGRLLIITREGRENIEGTVSRHEWVPLAALSVLTIGVCGLFPLVSSWLIEPYIIEIFGRSFTMSPGNVIIMSIMLAMVMLFPLSFLNYGKKVKVVDAYLAGANTESHTEFLGSVQIARNMEMKNYYLQKYFGEKRLYGWGAFFCLALSALLIVLTCLRR